MYLLLCQIKKGHKKDYSWQNTQFNLGNVIFKEFQVVFLAVLRIRIRKILASRIRIRKNIRIHGSGSKGQNINQKLQKNGEISFALMIDRTNVHSY